LSAECGVADQNPQSAITNPQFMRVG